jgi:acetyl esterase/lipase
LPAAILVWLAVAPIRRPRPLALFSWIATCGPNELPFVFLYVVAASTVPDLAGGGIGTRRDQAALAVMTLTLAGLFMITARAVRAGRCLDRALDEGLGARWQSEVAPDLARRRRHLPWLRILFLPWMFGRRDVERVADVAYGEDGTSNLLDVYRHRARPARAPTLIYLHGGGFTRGRKNREARPLLYHLAAGGWTCISANYRLARTPADGFPQHLIDVKRVIAWARSDGHRYGIDGDCLFVVGGSAGAHLAAMAALTANDPAFQPGFEALDTSITAGIGLYGYYGPLSGGHRQTAGPLAHVNASAPPFFVVHGDHDTCTPVVGARAFVDGIRSVSTGPVVYAELPGAQHSFDLFHSIRFESVISAIDDFAAWVRSPNRAAAVGEPVDPPTLPGPARCSSNSTAVGTAHEGDDVS